MSVTPEALTPWRAGKQSRSGQYQALPPTVERYVLRVSGRHQLALLLLSITVFALSAVPLEIQRRVVNDAFRGGAVDAIVWLAVAYLGVALLEGAIKLVLNVYRAWVSETAVLDLRRSVSALVSQVGHPEGEGTRISMVLSEAEPIGGFIGISLSEPLLQAGILVSVFGYLVYLHPLMALICAVAISLQMAFVPLMQAAINRRMAERIEMLRSVGDEIVGTAAGQGHQAALQDERIHHVFDLNMGVFRIKYGMNFLMNLMHHLSVATALGAGGYFAVQGRIEVGTVVAFVSGLGKLVDPWGDLVNWFREMTGVRVRYRLMADALRNLSDIGQGAG